MPRVATAKRKASNGSASSSSARSAPHSHTNGANGSNYAKKAKTTNTANSTDPLRQPHPLHGVAEQHGIVLRQYYPAEISTERVQAYVDGELPTPVADLDSAIDETAAQMAQVELPKTNKSPVVHWFKSDLRTRDNRALAQASTLAHENGVPLVGLYVVSPQDWEAHNTASVRVNLVLRTLAVLKADLEAINIPLWIETIDNRKHVPRRILELMDTWNARHLFANIEYEVDELRREAKLLRLCAAQSKAMIVVHDTCVVPPGQLTSGSGRQYAVYTPWFRAWKQYIHDHEDVVDLVDAPVKQPDSVRDTLPKELFDCPVPDAPDGKQLTDEETTRFRDLWPAGEYEATARLDRFCDARLGDYARNRDIPSAEATSALSPYLATGAISARTVVQTASDRTGASSLNAGSDGFRVWVSEVAWRDFYRHVLVGWPHICMNKPFKPAYADIEWAIDGRKEDKFEAWTSGRTGYPIVDAAMRQLLHEGWMHNRSRMVVASFLAKDLLLDWRRGEQWFMRHLVDGDLASNVGGWGFSASVGVDPQPYFRIFNPTRQSERFDPEGVYIRRWVPELEGITDNSAIHEPYARGACEQARATGYPEPVVNHKEARELALVAYKKALGRD